jgi:hypothetical protein
MRGHIGSLAVCGSLCNDKPCKFIEVFGRATLDFSGVVVLAGVVLIVWRAGWHWVKGVG